MTIALRVENISKQYRIYASPVDRLKESLTRGLWKRHQEFWALQDISFEVEKGTTTGIIGPNGGGKSTLLQIITGTLEPTHGNVWHDGKVAALLELGAGFNPEFTGIENVFMNASLMGFSRAEAQRMLPEIERFAEVGPFIHQPVKTYSSGMYIRLAFSVAISAAPDILIIDEALAVGDAIFQHRCMNRLKEMKESGVTILFVSHDPAAVRALCSRAILLNGGSVVSDGNPPDVLNRYQKIIMSREEAYDAALLSSDQPPEPQIRPASPRSSSMQPAFRHGDGSAEILGVEVLDSEGRLIQLVETGETVSVRLRVVFERDLDDPVFGFLIRNRHGIHIYGTNTELQELTIGRIARGDVFEITFTFPCLLAPDLYSITVASHSPDAISFDWLDCVTYFQVVSGRRMEGVANLNARVTCERVSTSATPGLAGAGPGIN